MSEETTAAEVLRRAAYRIAQPGAWCQHYTAVFADGSYRYCYWPPRCEAEPVKVCAEGAMVLEHYRAFADGARDVYDEMHAALRPLCGVLVTQWNDAAGRKQEEVVDALMRAADIVEAKEIEAVPLEECCV